MFRIIGSFFTYHLLRRFVVLTGVGVLLHVFDATAATGAPSDLNPATAAEGSAFLNSSSAQRAVVPDVSAGSQLPQSRATGTPAPDWNGIWRDTGIVFGAQAVAAGVTYVLPESFSNWSADQKKNGLKKYGHNFVRPVLDKDAFYVNYVLHPYWGATYYIRGRERGLDETGSFVYSALMSAMYEFGTECFAERPSIQDLIVTPTGGWLIGAYLFEPWRDSIKRKGELHWYDHAVFVVTDPLGVLSLGVEKLFGIKSTIIVNNSAPHLSVGTEETAHAAPKNGFTIALQFPFK
ncbi:MAG: DUF3943 domain-containing protein [Desulfuromonadaceae bacterium]|nr:DUF3943 domain-containing protein [Desulfuromonadaceae bacterium]MDD5106470.1 DUF3943 domain-containing protein [Desulfuromonadaceae bacterium]